MSNFVNSMLLLLVIVHAAMSSARPSGAEECTTENCRLPKCACPSTSPPGRLTKANMPQLVMLTFDDGVTTAVDAFYTQLLANKTNPNRCPISATFYVSHEYTDYTIVQKLYHAGHEIADHTISHRTPDSWWKTANETELTDEIVGQRTIISTFAQIPESEIVGYRSPFLQGAGDVEFDVLKKNGFLYDSTMPTSKFRNPPLFPYTFDYPTTQECEIQPCPNKTYPGLWEIPLVDLIDTAGNLYSMVDSFAPTDEDDAYNFLKSNFEVHDSSTHGPFGIYMHASWFLRFPFTVGAVDRFLTELTAREDVWLVSQREALEWMADPHEKNFMKFFEPFKCNKKPPGPGPCAPTAATDCAYPDPSGTGGQVYMKTCAGCPPHYPWVGNPTGQ